MMRGARRVAAVCILAALFGLVGCDDRPTAAAARPLPPGPVTDTRLAMGSTLTLTVWTADASAARAAFADAFAEVERLEGLLSVWRPGSDVERLNAAAGQGPVPLHEDVLSVLATARRFSGLSHGKFDVTFGALSGLWRFDHDQDDTVPAAADIAARLPLVGWEGLTVDAAAGTAALARPGMRVHLGGIGKGYAVDRVADLLRSRGFDTFLIQSGGDLYVAGRPEGRLWRLGIQDPRGGPDEPFAVVELTDATFSTSGDYERYFIKDGRRYHHLLDPDTGMPALRSRSVTIIAASATDADALSTAVFILGPEAGLALIEQLPDVEGVIVSAANEVRVSSGLRDRLTLLRPPADGP